MTGFSIEEKCECGCDYPDHFGKCNRNSEIRHVGLHAQRCAPEKGNPREIAFAKAWFDENSTEYGRNLLADLLIRRVDGYVLDPLSGRSEQLAPFDQHAASVAATVIQWLGSNVGFSFLEQALADCGFEIKRKRKPNV